MHGAVYHCTTFFNSPPLLGLTLIAKEGIKDAVHYPLMFQHQVHWDRRSRHNERTTLIKSLSGNENMMMRKDKVAPPQATQ